MNFHQTQTSILLILLLTFLFAIPSATAEIYLQASFDDKPLGAFIGTGGAEANEPTLVNSSVLATVENHAMPTPCLQLDDNSTILAGAARFEFIGNQEVTTGRCIMGCNLWFDEYEGFVVNVREQGTSSYTFLTLNFNSAGEIWYNTDGGGYGEIGTYDLNRYYPLWIDFNMDTGTFNLWFDLSPLLINESFGTSAHGIGAFMFGTTYDADTEGTFYVDDIHVADHFPPYLFLQANFNNKTLNAPIGTGGFEVGEPMNVGSTVTAVVRETPHHTPSLEIQDNDDYSAGSARFEFFRDAEVIGGELYLLSHLWFDEIDSYSVGIRENQGGAAEKFLQLSFTSSGSVLCSDEGGTVGNVGTYEVDRAYELLAVYNLDLGVYDLYWDGELVVDNEPHDVVDAGIGAIYFGCLNDANYDGRFYVDNIFVWQVPTPTTSVCCMDTDCGVMIPMDCAYNEGLFHPEWDSCIPNFCNPAGVDDALPTSATILMPPTPNPFDGTTTLRYQLSQPGEVSIEIYDIAGRRVRTLLSGPQSHAAGRVEWDGRDASGARVSPGVYFGRLLTLDDTVLQRMIIVK